MLLECGEDMDKKDEVLVFPSLCKSNACGFLHYFLALIDYEQVLQCVWVCASFQARGD